MSFRSFDSLTDIAARLRATLTTEQQAMLAQLIAEIPEVIVDAPDNVLGLYDTYERLITNNNTATITITHRGQTVTLLSCHPISFTLAAPCINPPSGEIE